MVVERCLRVRFADGYCHVALSVSSGTVVVAVAKVLQTVCTASFEYHTVLQILMLIQIRRS